MTFRYFSCQLKTCIYLMKIRIVIDTCMYKSMYPCIHINAFFTNAACINVVCRQNIWPHRYHRGIHERCRGVHHVCTLPWMEQRSQSCRAPLGRTDHEFSVPLCSSLAFKERKYYILFFYSTQYFQICFYHTLDAFFWNKSTLSHQNDFFLRKIFFKLSH